MGLTPLKYATNNRIPFIIESYSTVSRFLCAKALTFTQDMLAFHRAYNGAFEKQKPSEQSIL